MGGGICINDQLKRDLGIYIYECVCVRSCVHTCVAFSQNQSQVARNQHIERYCVENVKTEENVFKNEKYY